MGLTTTGLRIGFSCNLRYSLQGFGEMRMLCVIFELKGVLPRNSVVTVIASTLSDVFWNVTSLTLFSKQRRHIQ